MSELSKEVGAVLPCGGQGRRLAELTHGLPKSLLEVGGKELMRHSTDDLTPDIIGRIVFATGYGGELIKQWVEVTSLPQIAEFSEATDPGVLPAIIAGTNHLTEDRFVACNTDEIRLGLQLRQVIASHQTSNKLATMVVTATDKLYRHRRLEIRDNGLVVATQLKPQEYRSKPEQKGLVNTGFLVLEGTALDLVDLSHSRDWSGIIDPLCDAGQLNAYINTDITYFNVGTAEEYFEAERYLEQNACEC